MVLDEDPLTCSSPIGTEYRVQFVPSQWYTNESLQDPPPVVQTSAVPSTSGSPMPTLGGMITRLQRLPSQRNALPGPKSHTFVGPDAASACGMKAMPGTVVIRQREPFQCSRNSLAMRPFVGT